MRTSIVIATRQEPDLDATIADIKQHNPDAEMVIMEDVEGLGCMQMRHRGILKATGDVVICMDGHMRVKPDTIQRLSEDVYGDSTVACAQCYHHHDITFEGQPYSGAYIAWTSSEPGEQFWALPGKWRSEHTTGPIGCIMGASYAMSRDWYLDGLNAPWQFGTGWGCDEELLSIVNWIAGGENILSEAEVWHRARRQNDVPYKLNRLQAAGVWANRYRMLYLLPITKTDRNTLMGHLLRNKLPFGTDVYQILQNNPERIDEWSSKLKTTAPRTWADWRRTWCDNQTEVKMTLMQLRKQLQAKTSKYSWRDLMRMDKVEIERQLVEYDEPDEPKKDVREPLMTVEDPGIPCLHCGNPYDHRITNTYGNGNRRMICGGKETAKQGCGKPFISFRRKME